MGWIRIDPGLGYRVVQVGPLSHDVGITLEFVLLKPSLNIGSNQLTALAPLLYLTIGPRTVATRFRNR